MTVIEFIRKVSGLTRQNLAAKAGIHQAMLGRLERGEMKYAISPCEITAIASALGVDRNVLFNKYDMPEMIGDRNEIVRRLCKAAQP